MRSHTRKIIVAVILASAVVSTGQSAGLAEAERKPTLILTGNTEAAWIVLPDKGGSEYKLAVRLKGDKEKWKPVGGDWDGNIVSATSSGTSLVVFFSDPNGESTRYYPNREQGLPGIEPPVDLFGKDAKILASAPASGDDNAVMVLIARLPRRPQTLPAGPIITSQPAKSDGLALLRYASQKWRQVAVIPDELVKSATRAHLAVDKNAIYVLVEHPEETLLIFEAGKWRQVDLPDTPAGSKPLAMMILDDALVLATFDAESGVVNLIRRDSDKWQAAQAVKRDGKNLIWPADAPPAIARFAKKAIMMWKAEDKWLLATCEFDGQAGDESPMTAFTWADEQDHIERMQNIFFMVVFGAIVVLMFWPGQPLRTAPFSLPPTVPPAKLTRRFAAVCIDALPFLFVATSISAKDIDTTTITTFEQLFEQAKQAASTTRSLYAFWGFLVVYPAYCLVMEYRFGATVGKMILRLRVVADKGRKPLLRELALRNVSKAIEILGLVMVFPLLFPLLTRYRQRLGDKMAWTAVINANAVIPLPEPTAPEEAENHSGDEDEK